MGNSDIHPNRYNNMPQKTGFNMLQIFNHLNHIKQELSKIDECRVIARIRNDDLLEMEVYFPLLDYHIAHAYSSAELRTIEDPEIFTSMFIKKTSDVIKEFKKFQLERDKKVKSQL